MAGPHEFEIFVKSNDPLEPEKKLYLVVYFQASSEVDTSPPPGNQDAAP